MNFLNKKNSEGAKNSSFVHQRPLILCDREGRNIGHCEKLEAHEKGLLHQAFSLFVLDQRPEGCFFLLQKRAQEKYHCGGLWSNTCCSHPWPQEPLAHCVFTRLQEEMGIKGKKEDLCFKGTVCYKIFAPPLWEHERTSVFTLPWCSDYFLDLNPQEVSDYQWLSQRDIQEKLNNTPEYFTPWFPLVFKKIF